MTTEQEISDFRAAYVEFHDTALWPDIQISTAINIAKRYRGDSLMKDLATAHILTLFKQANFPLSSRSDGSVKVDLAVPEMNNDESFWSSSSYGRMWLALWNASGDSIATGFYGRS